jgi:hypothetical protein
MREVHKHSHADLWIQALEAKFEGKGFVWGRNDFEKILAGYDVSFVFLIVLRPLSSTRQKRHDILRSDAVNC